jgi:hypothetical protein
MSESSKIPLQTPTLGIPTRIDKFPGIEQFIYQAFLSIERAILTEGGGGGPGLGTPLMINLDVSGVFTPTEVLGAYACAVSINLPASLSGSVAAIGTSSPQTTSIDIQKNGISVGSIDIVADAVSFDFIDIVTFDEGDVITFVNGSSVSFDYFSVTLKASRNS